jgi:hypothetical protein
MAVRLTSLLVSGPIAVPLSSGGNVHLLPGQSSDVLPDVEVADNAKVDKLVRRNMLRVETVDESPGAPDEPSPAGGKGAGRTEATETTESNPSRRPRSR